MSVRFLSLLAETLDLDLTIKKLDITKEEARAMLAALLPLRSRAIDHDETRREMRPRAPHGVFDIYVDGASRGNPGKAGAGAIIKDRGGAVVKRLKRYLGVKTNNAAEYGAVIMALTAAKALGMTDVRVFADSELMVKQLSGVYKVKSEELRPLYDEAGALLRFFKTSSITHVYREANKEADGLANEAIDQRE